MSDEQQQACAVCGRTLEHLKSGGISAWIHILPMDLDHLAVPVDATLIQIVHRCDFCSEEPVTMVVLAEDFEEPPGVHSKGDWAACQTCADLIRRKRWTALRTRAHATLPPDVAKIMRERGMSAKDIKKTFKTRYERLQVHVRGLVTVEEYLRQRR